MLTPMPTTRNDDGSPDRNNGRTTGGRFTKGNSGRPHGARHKTTLAIEALMQGESEAISRKAIEMAKAGDMTAIKLVMDRIAPPRRDPTATFDLPKIESADDLPAALTAILKAVSEGELSPSEGGALTSMLERTGRSFELVDIEQRIAALEARSNAPK
jgi:hypothetical protein